MDKFNCPACGSEIATDGRALVKRSPRLEDLEQTAALVPKLEQAVKELQKEAERPRPAPRKTKPTRPAPVTRRQDELVPARQDEDPDNEFLR